MVTARRMVAPPVLRRRAPLVFLGAAAVPQTPRARAASTVPPGGSGRQPPPETPVRNLPPLSERDNAARTDSVCGGRGQNKVVHMMAPELPWRPLPGLMASWARGVAGEVRGPSTPGPGIPSPSSCSMPAMTPIPSTCTGSGWRRRRHRRCTTHPNCIVNVYDSGQHRGAPYLVMERLPGRSLAEVIAMGPVPPPYVQRMLVEVLAALSAAHAAGITTRPSNRPTSCSLRQDRPRSPTSGWPRGPGPSTPRPGRSWVF